MTTITTATADLLHALRVGSTTARHSISTTPEALAVHIEALTGSLVRISSQIGPEFSRCYAPAQIDVDGPTRAVVDVLDAAGLIKSLSDPDLPSQVRLCISAERVHLEIDAQGPSSVRLRMVTNRAATLPAPPAPAPAPLAGAVPPPALAGLPAGILADIIHDRAAGAALQLHGIPDSPELVAWTLTGFAHGRARLDEHAELLHTQAARMIRAHEARAAA